MRVQVARDEKKFQVMSSSRVAGKVLFKPKRWRRFPLRFAKLWYEYGEELVAEAATDNEGRFQFNRVPGFDGAVIISMICIIDGEDVSELHQVGGEEYRYRYPSNKGETIESVGLHPDKLEIVICDEEWQPDLILRDLLLAAEPSTPRSELESEFVNLYLDEIEPDVELQRIYTEFDMRFDSGS